MQRSLCSRSPGTRRRTRPFSFKRPLLAALAACSLLSCDPKIREKPEPPKVPMPVMTVTGMAAPTRPESMKPTMPQPSEKPDASVPEPAMKTGRPAMKPPASRPSEEKCWRFCELKEKGYGEAAPILHRRVFQKRKKMKLTLREGKAAAAYLVSDLPKMPNSKALLKTMPKTVIELIRSVNERGVTKKDAEQMADYLIRFLKSMRMRNLPTFDECISHMIGRQWHQIDYSGEGMTWQGQRKMYNRKSPERMDWVKDIRKVIYLHRFFDIEHRMRYFRRLFAPAGRMPPAPKVE